MAKAVVAAGLIVFRRMTSGLEYLLLKASYGDCHWSPPKGHVEHGETIREAALRETLEETGLTTLELHIHEEGKLEFHYQKNGRPKTIILWIAELKDPNTEIKLSHEHQEFKWMKIADAMSSAKYNAMKECFKAVDFYIRTKIDNETPLPTVEEEAGV